ncbi:MAG TPA: hypothetical protein VG992_02600, partial [Candidatus Saccharimonadales bacterium]|nr:hypothetical protein [Candidatus Saccharimonadales bacterium]
MTWLLACTALSGALVWLAGLIGAMYYDLRLAQAARAQARHPRARRYRQRPLVSVVIVTDGASVDACLQTVWASAYRKLEVVVVANGPVDATSLRQTLRGRGRLIVKRRSTDRMTAILSARRYLHGEVVLLLDPATRLERQTITAAITQYNRQPDATWILPDIQLIASTVSGIFQSYVALLGRRTYKFRQMASLPLSFAGPAVFCRTSQLPRQLRQGDQLGVYGAEVHLQTMGPTSLYAWWQQQYAAQRCSWQILTQRDWR